MEKQTDTAGREKADFFLDITQEVCPMTFVKTKLLIERMPTGKTAEIRLSGDEPLDNVPKSVKDHGHTVLAIHLEKNNKQSSGSAVYRLFLRKNET